MLDSKVEPVRLHLGCGQVRYPGFLGVDLTAGPAVDLLADLRGAWPWATSSVAEVVAEDVFEHLHDKVHTLRELWRVLEPGALATVQVPDAAFGGGAFGDPTHISFWTLESFSDLYMRPGPYHPGGYHFDVVAYPTEASLIQVGNCFGERRWVRAELRAVK